MSQLLLSVALVPAIFAAAAGPSQIAWHSTVDAAVETAKRDHRVILVAVNMDGERANDQLAEDHYRDPTIGRIAANTCALIASRFDHGSGSSPCPRFGHVTCAEHLAIERVVRKTWLEGAEDGSIIAPQHVFLDPDQKVLLSVPYLVSKGELEWCILEGIRRLDPSFAWNLSESARPPKRLVKDGVVTPSEETPATAPPPTKEEIETLIEALKDPATRGAELHAKLLRLAVSDDKKVLSFLKEHMSSRMAGGKNPAQLKTALHVIGRVSPPVYWELVAPFLTDSRPDVRREAAVALEQLAVDKALSKLLAQWKKEEEAQVKNELIRAIAAVAPGDKKSVGLIKDQVKKTRDTVLAANAVIAATPLMDRDTVLAIVEAALADERPALRAAAGYVIAVRKEQSLRKPLEDTALLEEEPAVKRAFEACLDVLNGAPLTRLDPLLRDFADSTIRRDRL